MTNQNLKPPTRASPSVTKAVIVLAILALGLAAIGYVMWSAGARASNVTKSVAINAQPTTTAAAEQAAPGGDGIQITKPAAAGKAKPKSTPKATRTPRPTATKRPAATVLATAPANALVMQNQTILGLDGSVVYKGDVDLAPVFARIEAGERDKHPNDGSVYTNREGTLPRKARGYYLEYVVRTKGLPQRLVGPQRLILGKNGDAWYTPDHYQTFIQVR
jgi:ribonuclease T1